MLQDPATRSARGASARNAALALIAAFLVLSGCGRISDLEWYGASAIHVAGTTGEASTLCANEPDDRVEYAVRSVLADAGIEDVVLRQDSGELVAQVSALFGEQAAINALQTSVQFLVRHTPRDVAAGPPGNDSCQFANDGGCDEPILCAVGTDATDCGRQEYVEIPVFTLADLQRIGDAGGKVDLYIGAPSASEFSAYSSQHPDAKLVARTGAGDLFEVLLRPTLRRDSLELPPEESRNETLEAAVVLERCGLEVARVETIEPTFLAGGSKYPW